MVALDRSCVFITALDRPIKCAMWKTSNLDYQSSLYVRLNITAVVCRMTLL